jgi:hypothetical protein
MISSPKVRLERMIKLVYITRSATPDQRFCDMTSPVIVNLVAKATGLWQLLNEQNLQTKGSFKQCEGALEEGIFTVAIQRQFFAFHCG